MSYGGFFPPAHYLSCHSCYIVISELIWVNTLPCLADESIWRPDQKMMDLSAHRLFAGFQCQHLREHGERRVMVLL